MTKAPETTLKANSLGLVESIIMGIAGTAPAYSIEITMSTMIGTTGIYSIANILMCGLIMFGIAFAFINLNKKLPDAGTSYAWITQIFGKTLGFFTGWSILLLCCIFMISATIPAANATLLIFKPDLVNDVGWVTAIAALWLTLISMIIVKGVKMTSYFQMIMVSIEGIILLSVIVMSLIVFPHHPEHPFSWSWFSPMNLSLTSFTNGSLIAIFFFYGWDVSFNLSEETKDSTKTPGQAAFWSMIFLMVFFVIFTGITLLALSDVEIQQYNTNIIFAIAEKLFGKTWGYVAIIAVLLSTVGTVETQIIQFTRILFSQGRAGTLHPRYSRLHPTWQTPYIAIFFIWFIGLAFLFISSYLPTIKEILLDSISALSFQIAFYLGITGMASAWYYRHMDRSSLWSLVTHIIWPMLSGFALFFIALYSIPKFDIVTSIVGIGGLGAGLIPLLINRRRLTRRQGKIQEI